MDNYSDEFLAVPVADPQARPVDEKPPETQMLDPQPYGDLLGATESNLHYNTSTTGILNNIYWPQVQDTPCGDWPKMMGDNAYNEAANYLQSWDSSQTFVAKNTGYPNILTQGSAHLEICDSGSAIAGTGQNIDQLCVTPPNADELYQPLDHLSEFELPLNNLYQVSDYNTWNDCGLWDQQSNSNPESMRELTLGDQSTPRMRDPPVPFQVPLPYATPTVYFGHTRLQDEDQKVYQGGRAAGERYPSRQRSPYNYDRQLRVIDQSTSIAKSCSPHPSSDAPLSPSQLCDEDVHTGTRNEASPIAAPLSNRDTDTEVTSSFSFSSPSYSTTSAAEEELQIPVDKKRAKKQATDRERKKALGAAEKNFKSLFPAAKTLLNAKEAAVKAIRYILTTGNVPDNLATIDLWWLTNEMANMRNSDGSFASLHHTERHLDGQNIPRKKVKKRAYDASRNGASLALNKEIRELFPQFKTLLDAFNAAYNFLIYAKTNGRAPEILSASVQLERQSNTGDPQSPFFDCA